MTNPAIGHLECPLCELEAEVRNTAKGKPYLTCDECGFQAFARGQEAMMKLRTKMRPIAAAVAAAFPNPPAKEIDIMVTPKKKPAKKPAAPAAEQETHHAQAADDDGFGEFVSGKKKPVPAQEKAADDDGVPAWLK